MLRLGLEFTQAAGLLLKLLDQRRLLGEHRPDAQHLIEELAGAVGVQRQAGVELAALDGVVDGPQEIERHLQAPLLGYVL